MLSFFRKPASDLSFPGTVGLETVNTCNARCPFCPLFQGDAQMDRKLRPAKIMDQALFEACVSEIAAWPKKPNTIFLNMNGEPLSDPLFVERLAVVKRQGLGHLVDLQTNGQYLTESCSKAILDAGVRRLTLGFDGATRETYAAHRVRCDFDKVLNNIRAFAKLRDDANCATRIAVQYVRTTRNVGEVVNAYSIFNDFLSPTLDVFQDTPAKDWGDHEGDAALYYIPRTSRNSDPIGCSLFADQMIVLSDGILAACCWDYNLVVSDGGFGNVRTGLLETWRASKRKKIESLVQSKDKSRMPEKCLQCPVMYEDTGVDASEAKMVGDHVTIGAASFTYGFTKKPSPSCGQGLIKDLPRAG
jgi:radical SAM protein with 4Fe4S-binding SPASM domain